MNLHISQFAQLARFSRERRGFTLVEILIVVAILGIIGAMALPRFGSSNAERLKQAAQLLIADIGVAQSESLAHGDQRRVMVFDLDNEQYHLALAATPETPIEDPVRKASFLVRFGEGRASQLNSVTIESVDLDGDLVLGFERYGNLDQASDARIVLACQGMSRSIIIDADTGEARLE